MFNHNVNETKKKELEDNTIKIFFQHAYTKVNKITKEAVNHEGYFDNSEQKEIGFIGKKFINNKQYKKYEGFDVYWKVKMLPKITKQCNQYPIIHIVLSGEQDDNVADGTILNADRLKTLIENLDLKNKILVFDNITCQGGNYLPGDNISVFERIKTIVQELDKDKQPNELHLGYQANGFRNMTHATNRQVYKKEDWFNEKTQYDFLEASNIKKLQFSPLGLQGVNKNKNEEKITEYNNNLLNIVNNWKQIHQVSNTNQQNTSTINNKINDTSLIVLQGLRKLWANLVKEPYYNDDGCKTPKDDLFIIYNYQNFFKPSFINNKAEVQKYLQQQPHSKIEQYIYDTFCYLLSACDQALSNPKCFEQNKDKYVLSFEYIKNFTNMESNISDERKRILIFNKLQNFIKLQKRDIVKNIKPKNNISDERKRILIFNKLQNFIKLQKRDIVKNIKPKNKIYVASYMYKKGF